MENLTGQFGPVEFVDGLSVEDVAPMIAQRLANLIRVELEDGKNPSIAQTIIDSRHTEMNTNLVHDASTGEVVTDDKIASEARTSLIAMGKDDLIAIADKEGIAGLRKIAEPLGIKGTSIAALITEIMKAQENASKSE